MPSVPYAFRRTGNQRMSRDRARTAAYPALRRAGEGAGKPNARAMSSSMSDCTTFRTTGRTASGYHEHMRSSV